MTTATVPSTTGTPQKMSRYRSIRRQQEYQQQEQSVPPMPSSKSAVPDMEVQKEAQISRSMSRYHRRPPPPHATTASPPVPPLRANTLQAHQPPPVPQSSTSRIRAVSSPQHAHSANTSNAHEQRNSAQMLPAQRQTRRAHPGPTSRRGTFCRRSVRDSAC
jgi:hypothetical protein